MTPLYQTPGDNQCLRHAVASLFELTLEEVPFFGGQYAFDDEARANGLYGIQQDRDLDAWLAERGIERRTLFDYPGSAKPWGLCLAYGETIRGTYHAVVWDAAKGEMAHDPHPSGAGLVKPDEFVCFVVVDPAKITRRRP